MRAKHPTCLGLLASSSTTETESERGLGYHVVPMHGPWAWDGQS